MGLLELGDKIMGYLRKLPIGIQLSIIALLIIIIMILYIFTSYFKVAGVIKENNNEHFAEMISQINQTISSNCDVINRMVQNIPYNSVVQQYLNEKDMLKKHSLYYQVRSYIFDMINMKDGIQDIIIIGDNGSKFSITGEIIDDYFTSIEIPSGKLFYYTGIRPIQSKNTVKNCFIVGTQIYSTTSYANNNKKIGKLMLVIDANAILGSNYGIGRLKGTKMYMVDREGKVFFTNDQKIEIGSFYEEAFAEGNDEEKIAIIHKEDRYISQEGKLHDIEGRIYFKMPQSELLRGLDDIQNRQMASFLAAMILLVIPFSMVANNILQPLKKFMDFINGIKSGQLKNLKKRIALQGYAEITIMANDFNQMLDEIDDLTHRLLETNTRLYEAELAKKRAEMEYLQSQINPHFLYNTLESIKGIAVEEGVTRIFNIAKSLGLLMRYSIKGKEIVSIDEELNIVKHYVYIQKVRFGDRLRVEYSFSEKSLKCNVLRMILQPIVENAIYHGIEPKLGEGHLQICGDIIENKLYITIKDDGVGIDSETLEDIRKSLAADQNLNTRGTAINAKIGIVNVNNRLKLHYGSEYGVNISSTVGEGTEVILILPCGSDSYV